MLGKFDIHVLLFFWQIGLPSRILFKYLFGKRNGGGFLHLGIKKILTKCHTTYLDVAILKFYFSVQHCFKIRVSSRFFQQK